MNAARLKLRRIHRRKARNESAHRIRNHVDLAILPLRHRTQRSLPALCKGNAITKRDCDDFGLGRCSRTDRLLNRRCRETWIHITPKNQDRPSRGDRHIGHRLQCHRSLIVGQLLGIRGTARTARCKDDHRTHDAADNCGFCSPPHIRSLSFSLCWKKNNRLELLNRPNN